MIECVIVQLACVCRIFYVCMYVFVRVGMGVSVAQLVEGCRCMCVLGCGLVDRSCVGFSVCAYGFALDDIV